MKNLFQMIKQAVTSLLVDHSGPFPRGQANYNGKTTEYVLLTPYGLISSPPVGSHALLFSSQGQESVKFGLVSDFDNKSEFTDEVLAGLRNNVSESSILLRENGDIEIEVKNDLVANVDGDVEINGSSEANISATTQASLSAPLVFLAGLVGKVGLAGVLVPATSLDVGSGAITLKEMIPPITPLLDNAALYTKDNGAGKTQLVIKWQTGVETVIATQP